MRMNIYLEFIDKDNNIIETIDIDDLTIVPHVIPDQATSFRMYGKIGTVDLETD